MKIRNKIIIKIVVMFRRESSVKIASKIEQLCALLLQERNKLAG